MKKPSKERGCDGKTCLGRDYKQYADRLALKHGKQYAVYICPHCANHHLTTKMENAYKYAETLYVTLPVFA